MFKGEKLRAFKGALGDSAESFLSYASKRTGVGAAIKGAGMGASAAYHDAHKKRKTKDRDDAQAKADRHGQRSAEVMGSMSREFGSAPQHHAPPPQQQYHHQPQQHQYHQPQQNRSWPTLRPAPGGRMMMSDRNTSQEYINRLREATLKEFTLFDLGLAGGALGTAGIMGWKAKKYWDKRKKKNTDASTNASINTGFDGRLTKLEQDVKAPVFPRLKQEARDEYGRLKAVGAQKIAGAVDRVGDHFRGGAKRESRLTDQAFLNLREGKFTMKGFDKIASNVGLRKALGTEPVDMDKSRNVGGFLLDNDVPGLMHGKTEYRERVVDPRRLLKRLGRETARSVKAQAPGFAAGIGVGGGLGIAGLGYAAHRINQARKKIKKQRAETPQHTESFTDQAFLNLREGFFSRAQPKKEEPPKAPSKKERIVSALKRHKGKIALAAGVGLGWQGLKAGSRHVKNYHTKVERELSNPLLTAAQKEEYRPAMEGSLKFKTGKWLKDFADKYRGAK